MGHQEKNGSPVDTPADAFRSNATTAGGFRRAALVQRIATEAAELAGWKGEIAADDVHVNGDYVGAGYCIFGDDVTDAVCMAARLEALLIDPVYTGKAMLGLCDLSRKGFFKRDEDVVSCTPAECPVCSRIGSSCCRRPRFLNGRRLSQSRGVSRSR